MKQPRPLHDEHDSQLEACKRLGSEFFVQPDEDIEHSAAWGADPFDIVAELEEEYGQPINCN